MIYFTSDLHFNHDKTFLYEPRGFANVLDMNQYIINQWNNQVTDDDDIYILGDLMLGDNDAGMDCLKQLKGKIHIILGNHDSDRRVELYKTLPNLVEPILYADIIQYKYNNRKIHFYISHYPTYTNNNGDGHISNNLINLFGHTHQQNNFFNNNPFMYHIGCDSHGCCLISADQIIEDIKNKLETIKNEEGDK